MKKKFRFIVVITVLLCLVCGSVTAFAEPDDTLITFPSGDYGPVETENFDDDSTEAPTKEITTEDYIYVPTGGNSGEVSTTRKPSGGNNNKPNTTKKPPQNNEREEEKQTSTTEEESSTLPEGSFIVYFERNNGTERFELVLNEPSLVPVPPEVTRTGFIFDGWYADAKFTKKWDFNNDIVDKETVLYVKWIADPNAKVYNVTVQPCTGGIIEVNPAQASVGEPVMITVIPDEGMRLVAGSITINGESTDFLYFNMPASNVVVGAQFEVVPEFETVEEKESKLPFIIGGIVLVVIIIAIVVLIALRRRDDFSDDEIDENGTVIDDDTDRSWVDESIVVEDGFKDGERIIGNYVPEDDFFPPENDEN